MKFVLLSALSLGVSMHAVPPAPAEVLPTGVHSQPSELNRRPPPIRTTGLTYRDGKFSVSIEVSEQIRKTPDANFIIVQLDYQPKKGKHARQHSSTPTKSIRWRKNDAGLLTASLIVSGPEPRSIGAVKSTVSASSKPRP